MTYARLLSDRVSAFSAIADAEKYDHLQLEGIKHRAAAKADYECAAKYVQYNLTDLSVEAIKTARELLVNAPNVCTRLTKSINLGTKVNQYRGLA